MEQHRITACLRRFAKLPSAFRKHAKRYVQLALTGGCYCFIYARLKYPAKLAKLEAKNENKTN